MIVRGSGVTAEQVVKDVSANISYFVPDPHLRLGDADSAHGVLFGQLAGYGEVAIKPHKLLARAEEEGHKLERVAEMGFDAVTPIHVAEGGLAAYLVMLRRAGLRHLGQVDWEVHIADHQRLQGIIIPTLGSAAEALASWRSAGIFHGDSQAKNMAYGSDGNSVYVDAEKTQFNPAEAVAQSMHIKDLILLGQSIMRRGLLNDRSPEFRLNFLVSHLLDPYLEQLHTANPRLNLNSIRSGVKAVWLEALEYWQSN